jgi:hypothetical protein
MSTRAVLSHGSVAAGTASPRVRSAGIAANTRLTTVAWIAQHELAHEQWVFEGKRIGAIARGSAWWIGDWLLYGTRRWGERYAEAAKVTGYDPKSLRNMRYVASRFQLSLRRDNLTYSHHALLAGFDAEQQCHWLDRAAKDRLSVEDLRIELRTARREAEAAQRGQETDGLERGRPVDAERLPTAVAQKSRSSSGAGEVSRIIRCPQCGEDIAVGAPRDDSR